MADFICLRRFFWHNATRKTPTSNLTNYMNKSIQHQYILDRFIFSNHFFFANKSFALILQKLPPSPPIDRKHCMLTVNVSYGKYSRCCYLKNVMYFWLIYIYTQICTYISICLSWYKLACLKLLSKLLLLKLLYYWIISIIEKINV